MASLNHSIGADSQYRKSTARSMPPITARTNQLGKAEDSSPEKPRSGPVPQHPIQFGLLPRETQEAKLKNISKIEANWGAPLHQCIPAKIRPRKPDGHTTKVKRHEQSAAVEDDPKQWGVELLDRLAEISDLTKNDLATALKELQTAVADRHYYRLESNHNIAELLWVDCNNALVQLRSIQKKTIEAAGEVQDQPPRYGGTASPSSTRQSARPSVAEGHQDKSATPTPKTAGAQASRSQASRAVSTPSPSKAKATPEKPRARQAVQTPSASPNKAPTAPMMPFAARGKRAQTMEAVSTPSPLKVTPPVASQQSTEQQTPAKRADIGAAEASLSSFSSNAPTAPTISALTAQTCVVTGSPCDTLSGLTGIANLFTSPNRKPYMPTSASPMSRKRQRMDLDWEMLEAESRIAEANRVKAEVDHKKLEFRKRVMMDLDREGSEI
ncbi:hypothetical protein W97_04331 [Coniosporium apollinis CBS 100218]|uniref:Uncharacterized protein n=1 Tax=Coniosporium apollinis (strain CBS 100218) TaxID=1168221 RepID=R7YTX4_CONA1|nr:uncharacterized protein W97_04331 [Coniosporium apollinis CBS 100218]EON65096.1 hypothetical protein W97_04331 [Coniosporium apollinis CBS 100218]